MIYSNSKRVDSERMASEILQLKDRILGYQESIKGLRRSLNHVEKAKELQKESYESIIAEKDAIIKELSAKLAHATTIINRNGTNTCISTAATPINEKKVIPNTRRGSGKAKGGQPGYEKHTLSAFDESEITQISEHELDLSVEDCDKCHGELFDTGEVENKDEFDVKVTVIKHRHARI